MPLYECMRNFSGKAFDTEDTEKKVLHGIPGISEFGVREDRSILSIPEPEKQTAHAGGRSLTAGAFQPRATPTVRKWDLLTRIERSVSSAAMGLELEGSCYWRVLPVVVHPRIPG